MKNLPLYGLLLLLLSACNSPEPAPTLPLLSRNLLADFREAQGAQPQYFDYDPQKVSLYFTTQGGTLAVGYHAFLSLSSSELATTPIRLTVREVYTKADMVLTGTPSMAGDEVLETGGQFFIRASHDNQSLHLSPRLRLGLNSRSPAQLLSQRNMQLYYAPSLDQRFNWALVQDTASSVEGVGRPQPDGPALFRCLIGRGLYDTGTGWISYGRPLATGTAPTTVQVHVAEATSDVQTAVYLVFADYNAVAQLPATGPGTFALPTIPLGTNITAVVIRADNRQHKFLFGQQQVGAVLPNQQLTPTLHEASSSEIVQVLRKL